jgi:4-amino-4-deoxy-L-arabinose transferase-like glycosyltransferase
MRIRRLWAGLVFALFCLPLFVGLGRSDVRNDEAIYSFGVDRLLESGDWLAPKSSPHENAPFFEKPPLKFWLVALPMQIGLMPHNEFGLRFWDALSGAIAFLYIFAIGFRMAGPACGAVAVLLLFVHDPLLFQDGLRNNNMEAVLFLSYCGGMFHFLEWARAKSDARGHAVAVGLYFVVGFMTKFVAALFLPVVIGAVTLIHPGPRAKFLRAWRLWAGVAALVVALVAPWFIYATFRFGDVVWRIMLGQHVYQRFTTYLDPEHLHPWHFYLSTAYGQLALGQTALLVGAGLVLLAVQTVRRRWLDGVAVLLWLILPVTALSFGTSKLYHYVYPFLPPLGLAGGYFVASLFGIAPLLVNRALRVWNQYATERAPGVAAFLRRPVVRVPLLGLAALAASVAVVTLILGPIRLHLGSMEIFRSSGLFRPAVVAVLSGLLAGVGYGAGQAVAAVLVLATLPVPAYRSTLEKLTWDTHTLRAASECVQHVQAAMPRAAAGLYLDLPDRTIGHPLYYYFRRVRPWARVESPSPGRLARYLNNPQEQRPILVWQPTYQEFRRMRSDAYLATVSLTDEVLLLLPGPYAVCLDPLTLGALPIR